MGGRTGGPTSKPAVMELYFAGRRTLYDRDVWLPRQPHAASIAPARAASAPEATRDVGAPHAEADSARKMEYDWCSASSVAATSPCRERTHPKHLAQAIAAPSHETIEQQDDGSPHTVAAHSRVPAGPWNDMMGSTCQGIIRRHVID